jgi:hypothetical protein
MGIKKTLSLHWLDFVAEPAIQGLALHEQQNLYRKLTDINYEIPWSVFKDMPHMRDLTLNEVTQRYKIYLDELDKVRQEQLMILEQYKQFDQTQEPQQTTLDWLNNYSTGQGRGPLRDLGRFTQPPHILLEDGDDLLLEDSGLILLEADSA